jgi:hypothetical protein
MMQKQIKALLCAFTMLLALIIIRNPVSASYAPGTQICWWALSSAFAPYACPPVFTNPVNVLGGTAGYWAYAFEDQIGINIHTSNGEYGNAPQLLANLQYLNIHHVRDGMSIIPGNSYVISTMNLLGTNGIKFDLLTTNLESSSTIGNDLSYLNVGDFDAIEGPNEEDLAGNGAWAPNDYTTAQTIYSYIQANNPTLLEIGPSIGGTATYANIGDLSAYVNYGNTHDYEAGFFPENNGWGSLGYCSQYYADVAYNLCNAKQAAVSKPVAATEFGYQVSSTTTNDVDQGAQGRYILRQIFEHQSQGISKSYIYALYDSGGQTYGVFSDDDTPRPAASEISGFMNILSDATPIIGSCTVPAAVSTSGISSFGVCLSNGQYALVVWQPVVGWDTNAKEYDTVYPINVRIAYSFGFGPSSVTEWTYPFEGQWTNSGPISHNSVPVTDAPSIVIFNGPSYPTPLPTLPPPS